jgi:predicted  nucleic acid-binding Zn-ribbon protein
MAAELEAQVEELRSRVVTLQQTSDQSYSSEEYQRLAEKIHELEVERGELRQQLAELRQAAGESSSTSSELPDPLELLNRLRGKFPKTKISRGEVVALMEWLF